MLAKLLMAAVAFALFAWLIETGVRLIQSVLPQLVVISIVGGLIAGTWWWFRGRSGGW